MRLLSHRYENIVMEMLLNRVSVFLTGLLGAWLRFLGVTKLL